MVTEKSEAPSQPVSAPAPETRSDEPKKSNLSVAQAAARLLNMETEKAQAAATQAEQIDQTPIGGAEDTSEVTEATEPESAEVETSEAQAEEGQTEDVLSQDNTLSEKAKKRIEKRIGEEVYKRKGLEATINELKLQLEAVKQQKSTEAVPITPLPQGSPALAQIESPTDLVALQQQAKDAKRFAQEQLDRDDFEPVRVGDTVLDRKALKTIIRNAERTLEDEIPQRAQFLQQRQAAQQLAYEKFPFLKDKSSPEYVQAQQAYMQMPWLKNLPNADWIIGVQIEGLKALQSKDKKATGKTAKAQTPFSTKPPSGQSVVSSSGDARTPSGQRAAQTLEAMRSQMSKSGGVSANQAAQFLLARELAKQNR
jgi:hypothetical protein